MNPEAHAAAPQGNAQTVSRREQALLRVGFVAATAPRQRIACACRFTGQVIELEAHGHDPPLQRFHDWPQARKFELPLRRYVCDQPDSLSQRTNGALKRFEERLVFASVAHGN